MFHAVDVKTGKVLWETKLATAVQGFPVSYSIGGKQYVAVTTGKGGGSPWLVPNTISPEINPPNTGYALYVFALPDKMSSEKINLLKAYGAEVVVTPTNIAPDSPDSYNGVADRLAREIPGAWRPNQFTNMANPDVHYRMTGPDTLEYEALIEDAAVYSRPWTLRTVLHRVSERGARIVEDECLEDANGVRHHISPSDPKNLLKTDYSRWKAQQGQK